MEAENNVDRRIIRTKMVIREALISLIEEKGFDALSVKDITTRADINRGTFYLHYRDKYDLLEQTVDGVIHAIESIIKQAEPARIRAAIKSHQPIAVWVPLLIYLRDNASLLHAIVGPKGNFVLQLKVKRALWNHLFDNELVAHLKKEHLLVPSEYLIAYVASAHFGVIRQWLQGGCKESPEEMALILTTLSVRGPIHALGIAADQ